MHAYVVGNVTVDETISVAAVPEAGASILGRLVSRDLGGKGANQAVVMARCGLPTTLIAAVGTDFRSDMIRQRLAREPVDGRLVEIAGGSSDFSVVFAAPDGENAIVTTTESAEALSLSDAVQALSGSVPGDLVILQGNLTHSVTRGVLEHARTRGMVTAFNPSPLRGFFADLWPLLDIAFLNQGEALALTGADDERAARRLIDGGVKQVVLTFGSGGAMLAGAGTTVSVPAEPSVAVDTTGAGDTFMATALASAALRRTFVDRRALEHATRAAALTVGRWGTHAAFPTIAELSAIISR
jgi:ribokinase